MAFRESVGVESDGEEVRIIMETPFETQSISSDSSTTEGVEIQHVSVPFCYTIPRFSCITFTIRQMTFATEITESDTSTVMTYDGFIFDHPSLDEHDYPASIDVLESCFVEVTVMCTTV